MNFKRKGDIDRITVKVKGDEKDIKKSNILIEIGKICNKVKYS